MGPEVLIGGHYSYFSSVSGTLLQHSRSNAEEPVARLRLDSHSRVVEIASSDGRHAEELRRARAPALGIDPAAAPARAAIKAGVPTLQRFFGCACRATAGRGAWRRSDHRNSVLAHVPDHVADLNGLVAGIALLREPRGRAVLYAGAGQQVTMIGRAAGMPRRFRALSLPPGRNATVPCSKGGARMRAVREQRARPSGTQ